MYYLGFLSQDPKHVVIFKSLKMPKKGDFKYFASVSGPYDTEVMARHTLSQLKKQYGYKENPCECKNPAKIARKSNPGNFEKMKAQMIENIINAGTKAGRASKNHDQATVAHWKDYLIRVRPYAKTYEINADKLYNEAYRQGSGFYNKNPAKISVSQIQRGTIHELEHTTDRAIARKIAMDHLKEDPKYYTHLAKMEKQYKKNPFSGEKAVKLTKKLIRAYEAFRQENPGKSYHDQKFMSYMKELEKYAIGSVPYIGTLAKAYEHLESAKES